ncbi:MAG: hypothetical protein JSW71_08010 [Gemmatimonadota bacterium]|nr:MAG: hypothetical protein JSW71_08010 [Gemmatimonadota bacterium]
MRRLGGLSCGDLAKPACLQHAIDVGCLGKVGHLAMSPERSQQLGPGTDGGDNIRLLYQLRHEDIYRTKQLMWAGAYYGLALLAGIIGIRSVLQHSEPPAGLAVAIVLSTLASLVPLVFGLYLIDLHIALVAARREAKECGECLTLDSRVSHATPQNYDTFDYDSEFVWLMASAHCVALALVLWVTTGGCELVAFPLAVFDFLIVRFLGIKLVDRWRSKKGKSLSRDK